MERKEPMRKINRINFFLLAMIILLSAFLLPVVSSKWMQRTLEERSSTIDLNVTLYQREFADLWEKIETLEKSFASKQVQQKKVVITDEMRKKFTASAQKQLETLSNLQWFHSFPELTEESLQAVYEYTIISNDDCSGMVWYQLQFQDVSMLMDPDTGVAVRLQMLTESAAEDFFSMEKYVEVNDGNMQIAVDVGKDKNKIDLKQDSLRWELFQYNQAMLPELLPSNYGIPTGDYIYSGTVTESEVSNIVNIDGVIFLLEYVPYEERVMVRLGFFETGQLMPLD